DRRRSLSLRVFWHQVSPSNWSLGLHLYSRYDALPKFSCVPTASPSTAYSVGAAIALPYKTTYAKTTMPAPIATAPILRRTRRLLLTSKRCVVGDGSDMAPPSDPEQHPTLELRRDWDTSWGAAEIVRRCALFTTWRPPR